MDAAVETITFWQWLHCNNEIIAIVIDSALLLITVISAIIALFAYRHQKKRRKKEEACNLAKFYSKNIICKYSLITRVLERSGITARIRECFDMNKIADFSYEELSALLSGANVEDFISEIKNIEPGIILSVRVAAATSPLEREILMDSYIKENSETGEKEIVQGSYLQQDFFQDVSDLLNELEWFSMTCRYGIADETLIYQSLHQTFLSTVWLLYVFIANLNKDNVNKYYTNIIWLFKLWWKRLDRITTESAAMRNKALKKANRALARSKGKVFSGRGV